jgi:hypothetical protein
LKIPTKNREMNILIKTFIVIVSLELAYASGIFNWTDDNGNSFTVSDEPIQSFSTKPINTYTFVRNEDGKTYHIVSSIKLNSEDELKNVIEKYFIQKEKLQIQMNNMQTNMANMGENIRNNVQKQMDKLSENMNNIFGNGFPFNKK